MVCGPSMTRFRARTVTAPSARSSIVSAQTGDSPRTSPVAQVEVLVQPGEALDLDRMEAPNERAGLAQHFGLAFPAQPGLFQRHAFDHRHHQEAEGKVAL